MRLPYKFLVAWAALILGCGFSAAIAEAHSIYIFAFPENSRICTNSYFGGKAKVRGGQVSMATVSGEVLATAQTDEQGQACFDRPEPIQDLLFTVEASGGHRAEFTLPASEIPADDLSAPQPRPKDTGNESAATVSDAAAPTVCAGELTMADMRTALSPIMLKLAEMESAQNSQINLKDIIGGLGWLIGLAGAALWATGRKNAARSREKS